MAPHKDKQLPHEDQMPGIGTALTQGLWQGGLDLAQSGFALAGERPEADAQRSPAAATQPEPSLGETMWFHVRGNFVDAFARPLGPSDEFMKPVDNLPGYAWPLQAVDNLFYRGGGAALDAAGRTLGAIYNSAVDVAADVGTSSGLLQAAEKTGVLGSPEQFRRDFEAMPEAFAGMANITGLANAAKSAVTAAEIQGQKLGQALEQGRRYELRFEGLGASGGNVRIVKKAGESAATSAAELAKANGLPTGDQLPPYHYWSSRTTIDQTTGQQTTELFLQRRDSTKVDLHRYNVENGKFELIPETRILPKGSYDHSRVGPFKPVNLDDIRTVNVNGTQAKQIREGWNDKVSVIGRSMHGPGGVVDYTNELNRRGYQTHLFAGDGISPASRDEWKDLKDKFGDKKGLIPQYRLFGTLGYRENLAWANRVVKEGYTVVDIGNPNNQGFSVYYAAEKKAIFGGSNDK